MNAWMRNLSLKYKFWAVNLVAFATTLLLALFAMQQEQQGRTEAAQQAAQDQATLLAAWPQGTALPESPQILRFAKGSKPKLTGLEGTALVNANGWVALPHDNLWGDSTISGAWGVSGGMAWAIASTRGIRWPVSTMGSPLSRAPA